MSAHMAAAGVSFVDPSRVFATDTRTLYVDACHFNHQGSVTIGRALGDAVVRILAED